MQGSYKVELQGLYKVLQIYTISFKKKEKERKKKIERCKRGSSRRKKMKKDH